MSEIIKLEKALAELLSRTIASLGAQQSAALLKVSQPRLSAIANCDGRGVSIRTMLKYLDALGVGVSAKFVGESVVLEVVRCHKENMS